MFRIRRIYDDVLPRNRAAVEQVQTMLSTQFPGLDPKDIRKLPEQLRNPLKYRFRAILDVDYHHGNGQQEIFYETPDVLTVSIHGHPSFAYPYFSGFEEERGSGPGLGANVNYPLPEALTGEQHRAVLDRALKRIARFRPRFLLVALGLDTAGADPTGTWSLRAGDFEAMGEPIGAMGLPTVVVQEGGYNNRFIGTNARRFFTGLWAGTYRDGGPVLKNNR